MNYKKVFSKTRFQTKTRNSFHIDHRSKRILAGTRGGDSRTVFIGKVIEQGRTSTVLDYGVYCDVSFPHVIGIFGNRGSGKSFDLGVFLEELYLSPGEARQETAQDAAIVFDVQDQFWTLAYEPDADDPEDAEQLRELGKWGLSAGSVAKVSFLVPATTETQVPGANRFSLPASEVSEADYLAILELERFSPMGQALLTLLEARGSSTPGELALSCNSQGVLSGFQEATVDGVRWRLESLERTGIVDNEGIVVDELLQPGRLSVILMRKHVRRGSCAHRRRPVAADCG